MDNANQQDNDQEIIDTRSTQIEALSTETLKVATEALVEAYRVPLGRGIGMESQDDSKAKGLIARMGEKIQQFFKWVRELVAKLVDFLSGKDHKRKGLIDDIDEFEKKYKGKDKVRIDVKIAGQDPDDLATYPPAYRLMVTTRAQYIIRKQQVLEACNKMGESQVYFAAQFMHRGKEKAELAETFTAVADKLAGSLNTLLKEIGPTKSISEITAIINKTYDDFRKVSVLAFKNEAPNEGVQEYLDEFKNKLRFQGTSPEDLIPVIGDALRDSSAAEIKLSTQLKNLQTGLNKFEEFKLTSVNAAATREEKPGETTSQDYYQALALLQKMVTQTISTLRTLITQVTISDEYCSSVRSAMNAYESVVGTLRDLTGRKGDLDKVTSDLFEQVSKEFL